MEQPCRIAHRDVSEERAYGSEPGVPAARGIAPRRLHMDKKVGDEVRAEVFDLELGR